MWVETTDDAAETRNVFSCHVFIVIEILTHTFSTEAVIYVHYDDVILTLCCFKSPAMRLFVYRIMRTHIKETSKSTLLACEGNSPVTSEFLAQKGQ